MMTPVVPNANLSAGEPSRSPVGALARRDRTTR